MTTTFFSIVLQDPAFQSSVAAQDLVLGILITFLCSAITAGFVAKRLDVREADYSKAVLATFAKNLFGISALFLGWYLQMHLIALIVLAGALVPIVVYRLVLGAAWPQAMMIWFVVSVVEVMALFGVVQAGLFDWRGLLDLDLLRT